MLARLSGSPTLQLLLATLCGALLGVLDPALAVNMKPLSDAFIRLIGWLMPLMMFLLTAAGMAGLALRQRGLAGKVLVCFQGLAVLSLGLGCLVAELAQPGASTVALAQPSLALRPAGFTWSGTTVLLSQALLHNPILQIMLAGLATGALINLTCARRLHALLERATALMFRGLRMLLRLTPLAAFGAMAYTLGKFGPTSMLPLLKFLGVMYLACAAFILLILAPAAQASGTSLWALIRHVKAELALVTFTGSSVAALAGLVEKLQALGCDRAVVRLVLTTGYSFNLCGSNLYLIIAVLFLAQMAGIGLTATDLLTLLVVALMTSLGSTSMAGSAFFTLLVTLNLLHIVPADNAALLLGVERLMKCRVLTNVLGNCVACLAIARWQHAAQPATCRDESVPS